MKEKIRLLIAGLLVGLAIGLMIGGAAVEISDDGSGKREYPQGLALTLAIVGGVAAARALREKPIPPPAGS